MFSTMSRLSRERASAMSVFEKVYNRLARVLVRLGAEETKVHQKIMEEQEKARWYKDEAEAVTKQLGKIGAILK